MHHNLLRIFNKNQPIISIIIGNPALFEFWKSIIPLYEPTTNGLCSCKNQNCSSVGKHPRIKNGLKDGSSDPDIIQKWWKKWPQANIGLITGQSSGIFVLDIDPKNGGFSSLKTLEEQFGPITTTKVLSGGKGFHFYFSLPQGLCIKNKVNLLSGIDIRSENGYIVAPPSFHASQSFYEWALDLTNLQEIPQWLIPMCSEPNQRSSLQQAASDFSKHAQGLTLKQPDYLSQGQRNSFLASVAGSLCKHRLSSSAIEKTLQTINTQCCLPHLESAEVLSIAQSISRYKSAHEDNIVWLELIDFRLTTYVLPILERSYLPSALEDWIIDIATRMQISYEMITVPAIVAIGSLIGRKIRIYPKKNDNWLVTPNLWGAIVARPGTFKSPAIAEALAPLEAIVSRENAVYEQAFKRYEIDKSIQLAIIEALKTQLVKAIKKNQMHEAETLKEKLTSIQQDLSENSPKCKRLKTNDATIEKVVELLIENPNGLLMLRDELSGWLVGLTKPGREGDREFFLETWASRSSYTVDRIGRGTVHVPSLSLSVFGGLQPDKLERLITSSLDSNDDGLLQRLQLIVTPNIPDEWENHDVLPNSKAQKSVEAIFQKIHTFTPINDESFKGLHFDDEAQIIFNSWRTDLEELLRKGKLQNQHYEAHLSKYRSLIPALSLIFEILDNQNDQIDKITSVRKNSLLLALKWSEYLIEHAKKIYRLDSHPYDLSIQTLAEKIQAHKIKDGDTVRSIGRKCWEHLTTTEQIDHALAFLSEHNWLQVIELQSIGRPSRIIKLHPSLLSNI